MKIGTVDALQGAERAILLFSPVYTTEDHRFDMIDNQPNRLNVAVSRARDSFLLFGDMEIFDDVTGSANPRHVLGRHMLHPWKRTP
jgi:superfamily I DNA and/or RNA helicase